MKKSQVFLLILVRFQENIFALKYRVLLECDKKIRKDPNIVTVSERKDRSGITKGKQCNMKRLKVRVVICLTTCVREYLALMGGILVTNILYLAPCDWLKEMVLITKVRNKFVAGNVLR